MNDEQTKEWLELEKRKIAALEKIADNSRCKHLFDKGPYFNMSNAYYQCSLCGQKQRA